MKGTVVVVGAGIAGLAAAYRIKTLSPPTEVVLLEASRRAGGLIDSERTEQGLLIEYGPDCLHAQPSLLDMAIADLSLEHALIAPARSIEACVHWDGVLQPLPVGAMLTSFEGVGAILTSPLLSLHGKLRLVLEPLLRRKPDVLQADVDESVADFIKRRCGEEFLGRIADPLLSSIYATPTDELSAECTLGSLRRFERDHHSIAGGLFHKVTTQTTRRCTRVASSHKRMPGHAADVLSFRDGMSTLPRRIAGMLQPYIRYGSRVERIQLGRDGRYHIETSAGALQANAIVMALPVPEAARLTEPLHAELAHALSAIRVVSLHSVGLAYPSDSLPAFCTNRDSAMGTGFVVSHTDDSPQGLEPRLQACTWSSRKFADRAPDDVFLARCTVSGSFTSEHEACAFAEAEIRHVLGAQQRAVWSNARRIRPGLPSYTVGHKARVRAIREAAAELPAFTLTGNAYDGLGVPQCITSGFRAAEHLL
jgi:oxygen-dependent protoporphyrinogen oxidase